ncbi:hypothetical protein BDY21DRAFT_422324 [Lineolata rhizophorae]|uniref:Potassium channel tetramerisation-type BTB domain-containing protein n=1 Tax=Lineolata rhizophorae TaxID=578093 RepID=A0A6A6NYI8_9PEZI|nr:hypothetical protein BDY21DRAFT_422324 [Lineolata rhizophorae]
MESASEAAFLQRVEGPVNPRQPIQLRVGERTFTTTWGTIYSLDHSIGEEIGPYKDDQYFLDADGDTFAYILQYLRSRVLPIIRVPGTQEYDIHQYALLLADARRFQITPLVDWIQSNLFMNAVTYKMHRRAGKIEDLEVPAQGDGARVRFTPTWFKSDVYVCPRGIPSHRGVPRNCGKQYIVAIVYGWSAEI